MTLRWNDALNTVLAAGAVAVTAEVTQGWSWPLLSGYRAGVIALTLIGFGMCAVGGYAYDSMKFGPYAVGAGALGVTALGLVIYGLIAATETAVVALAAVIVALWVVTTIRHALIPSEPRFERKEALT
jgi:hypothetical protein